MTDPAERPDPGLLSEAAGRAVQADRVRVDAAAQAARRRRSSVAGRLERGWRWLRNRQTGPLPRLRRVAGVLRATTRARGPWRALPEALATALLAPVRVASKPPAARPPRDWAPEREAAGERLATLAGRCAGADGSRRRLAVIADGSDLEAWAGHHELVAIRPEDWAVVLEGDEGAKGIDALVVTATPDGNHGAWAYRIGWVAHPDGLLHRDLGAVISWCRERDVPSIFVIGEAAGEPGRTVLTAWADGAALFDVVVAVSAGAGPILEAHPDRQGVGVRIVADTGDLARILAAAVSPGAGAATPSGATP